MDDSQEVSEESDCWYIIAEDELLRLLKRAHDGEDPELLSIEAFANSQEYELVEDDDDEDPEPA